MKNVKYGLLEVFERGILPELCLYMSPIVRIEFSPLGTIDVFFFLLFLKVMA